ncbi:MAG: nitrite reductase (NAD(P)H) small subunit [Bacteroidota bacterium]
MKWYKIFGSLQEAEAGIPQNAARLIVIRNQQICLARTNSAFFAIDNACPHMKEALHKGLINHNGEITCPLHEYRYKLSNGEECQSRTRAAKTFNVKTNEHGLYIGVSD